MTVNSLPLEKNHDFLSSVVFLFFYKISFLEKIFQGHHQCVQ